MARDIGVSGVHATRLSTTTATSTRSRRRTGTETAHRLQLRDGGPGAARRRLRMTWHARRIRCAARTHRARAHGPHRDVAPTSRTTSTAMRTASTACGGATRSDGSERTGTTASAQGAIEALRHGMYRSGCRRRATRRTATHNSPRSPRANARRRSGAVRGMVVEQHRGTRRRSAHGPGSTQGRRPPCRRRSGPRWLDSNGNNYEGSGALEIGTLATQTRTMI